MPVRLGVGVGVGVTVSGSAPRAAGCR